MNYAKLKTPRHHPCCFGLLLLLLPLSYPRPVSGWLNLDPPQLRSKKKKEDNNLFLIPLAYTPPDDDRKTKMVGASQFPCFLVRLFGTTHPTFLFPYFSFRCERPERERRRHPVRPSKDADRLTRTWPPSLFPILFSLFFTIYLFI